MFTLHFALRVFALLALLGAVLDVFSTIAALRQPNVTEANPIQKWSMAVFGTAWVIPRLLLADAVIAAAVYTGDTWGALALLAAAAALETYAVLNNGKLAGWF